MAGMSEVRETATIDYWSPDGQKYRAWREMKHGRIGFVAAQNADRASAHWVDFIRYISFDGAHWCAKWSGDEFIHFPDGRPADQHRAQVIDYVGWHPSTSSREAWQAYWDGRRNVFVQTKVGRA